MNAGSMGDVPPRTRVRAAFSARTAAPASAVMSEKTVHPSSSSKSQWERLFGSFQSITASITIVLSAGGIGRLRFGGNLAAATDEHLRLRLTFDGEAGAAEHGHHAGLVRDPPVGGIAGVTAFDEVQLGIAGVVEDLRLGERVVVFESRPCRASPQHALEDQHVARHVFVDEIERQQRMPEVIEDAHEEHDVETLLQAPDLEHRQLSKVDVDLADLGGEPRLCQVALVAVDSHHARGAAALHFNGIEPGVTADVEDGAASQIGGDGLGELCPLEARIVSQEMVGRRRNTPQVQIVEPTPEIFDAQPDLRGGEGTAAPAAGGHQSFVPSTRRASRYPFNVPTST